VRGLVNMVDWT